MDLEAFRRSQMAELFRWADSLENILTPDKLNPATIKDFPNYIETSERLKRICDWMARETKDKMQELEDAIMQSIESEEYVFSYNGGGMPVIKKKFPTADKRKRELRSRLKNNEEYQTMLNEYQQWKVMHGDWYSHEKRLHRDFRLLEVNYQSNGGEGVNL